MCMYLSVIKEVNLGNCQRSALDIPVVDKATVLSYAAYTSPNTEPGGVLRCLADLRKCLYGPLNEALSSVLKVKTPVFAFRTLAAVHQASSREA
jgi:hypothetical protein